MASLDSHSTPMDDVFDEDQDESVLASNEWKRLEANRVKDGFRDGVEKSRDAKLQEGFDDGYRRSAELGERLGKLRGMLSAIMVFHMKSTDEFRAGPDERVASIEGLLSEVSEFEAKLPSRLKTNARERTTDTPTCSGDSVDDARPTNDDSAINERWGELADGVLQLEKRVDSLLRELDLGS